MNSSKTRGFMLEDLIATEGLVLCAELGNVVDLFELVYPKDRTGRMPAPLMVGIDGSVTAGKSFLAAALQAYLSGHGQSCVAIHGDWFMTSRDRRKKEVERAAKGGYEISEYDAVACDFAALERLQRQICNFMKSDRSECQITIPNAYNRETGALDKTIQLGLDRGVAVIVEGTGVLCDKMRQMFDLSIRVDIGTYAETVRRLVAREGEKVSAQRLAEQFVTERYNLIDCPYDQYLRARDRACFDILLDTSSPEAMRLYKRP